MCQGCVDGGVLKQSTYDKIEDFNDKFPEAQFSNAHIVLADCNIEDNHIQYCLDLPLEPEIREFLNELLLTPESER